VLNGQKIDFAKNIQLFDIQLIYKNIDFSKYDALIFSSKNGILGAENIDKSWRDIPSYVISEQSAKLAKDLGSKLSFVSSSRHGDDFAHELIDELKGKKALYLRASEIVSDMLDILRENGIECDDEVVYENKPKRYYGRKILPKNSKIIFSSPSTIRYFLDVFSWDESYKAISIGKTTAKYFPEHIKPIIADKVSLDSCVKKALSLG
jgi:uroporphyrinogen-III synthase